MTHRLLQSVGAFLLALAVAPASPAASVTFGDPGSTAKNFFPFGGIYQDGFGGDEYQQVYGATGFSGPVSITSITFYATSDMTPNADGTYVMSLSTTSAAVNGLDPDMANNVGADNDVFFDGTLPASSSKGAVTYSLATPLLYDPAAGNLLLDIQISDVTNNTIAYYVSQNGDLVNSSRMVDGTAIGTSAYGLVTTLAFTPASAVPEPGTLGMAAMGCVAVAGLVHRRRRSS